MPGWVARLSARTSLRVKLIAAALSLVAVALIVISVASVSSLRAYLLDQTDRQLATTATRVVNRPRLSVPGTLSQYVIQIHYADGRAPATHLPPWRENQPLPSVPSDPEWIADHARRFVTVGATSGDGHWRVYVQPIPSGIGSVVVASDLRDVNATMRKLIGVDVVVGGLVVVLLAGLGVAIVRASLRPLAQIEQTAAAIAAGDLSRRVPDANPGTEVGRLGLALNGMLTQIEGAFHARARSEAMARGSEERMRRFVADASHELRTPLSVIRGFAEYYRQRGDVDAEELDGLIGRVESEAERMGLLVEDLLLLARLDQQRPLDQAPVDLLALAAEAVQNARVVDPERDISLSVRGESAFIVAGDGLRLSQVVGNLLSNGIKHTPAGTPIEVIMRPGRLRGAPAAVLEVADSGRGMPAEQAERVFERFYRADPARGRGGTGLGLAIVAGIVHAHAGTVELETAPGRGATFCVTLPLAPDAAEPSSGPSQPGSSEG